MQRRDRIGSGLWIAVLFCAGCGADPTPAETWQLPASTGDSYERLRDRCLDELEVRTAAALRRDIDPADRGNFLLTDPHSAFHALAAPIAPCRTLRQEWPGEPEDDASLMLIDALTDPDALVRGRPSALRELAEAAHSGGRAGDLAMLLVYDRAGDLLSQLEAIEGDAADSAALAAEIAFGVDSDGTLTETDVLVELAAAIPELDPAAEHTTPSVVAAMGRFVVADLHRLARCAPQGALRDDLIAFLELLLRRESVETGHQRTLEYFERNLAFFEARCSL